MPKKPQMKRFGVSFESCEYAELRRIAQTHRLPLSFQYIVRYVLQRFFDEHRCKQLPLDRR